MGRIIVPVTITNVSDPTMRVVCDGLIDTGAWGLTLPASWKDRLGSLEVMERVELVTADQRTVPADVCGPVRIQVSRFRPISSDVVFADATEDPDHPALIGYTVLEQAGIIVDLVGHRLVKTPHYDLKTQLRIPMNLRCHSPSSP